MSYAAELDDVRQEVRRGFASNVIRFWPKVPGIGNVAASGTPTYAVFDPFGKQLASGNATVVAVDGVSRLEIPIDASDTTVYLLRENYRIDITWGDGTRTYMQSVRFDSCREPYVCDVSLNDLQDEVAEIGSILKTQAQVIDAALTPELRAAVLGVKAWVDVRQWLKAQLEQRARIYPRLFLDREAIRRVVVAQTIARVYRGQGGGRDSPARATAEDWEREAHLRLSGLGEMDYYIKDYGVADTRIGGLNAVVLQRSWGSLQPGPTAGSPFGDWWPAAR